MKTEKILHFEVNDIDRLCYLMMSTFELDLDKVTMKQNANSLGQIITFKIHFSGTQTDCYYTTTTILRLSEFCTEYLGELVPEGKTRKVKSIWIYWSKR